MVLLMDLDFSSFLQSFVTVLLGVFCIQWFLKFRKLPPGPWGLPIVGYIPFLKQHFREKQFKELSLKYGDVFGFNIGQQYVVVFSSFDAIKESLIQQADIFSGRPQNYSQINVFQDFKSTIVTDGEVWKEQRRFHMSSLREFGLGKLSIEGKIHEEVEVALDLLRQGLKKSKDLPLMLNYMTTNVICSLCFGQRFDHNDKRMERLMNLMDETEKIISQVGLVDAFPLLGYLPASWNGLDKIIKIREKVGDFVDEIVEEHIETFDSNNPRDVIDMYLVKRKELGIKPHEDDPKSLYSREYMKVNLTLLFVAGTDTTATTLHWALKFMAMYPEIQKKVQQEVDTVIGRSRLPSWTDRSIMPFTEATLLEVQRISSIVPLSVLHCNTEKTVVKGFTIPKRSLILNNLWQIHFDPKLWKNPDEFNPNRFLNAEGKVSKPEYLIPFSAGKRICLGESLAKMEMFIFFVAILQNFSLNSNENCLKYEVEAGVIRKTLPFDATIEPR